MTLTRCLMIGFTVFSIAGCSSKPDKPEQFFSTHIKADGTKQFALTIEMNARKKGSKGRGKGDGERKERGRKNQSEKADGGNSEDMPMRMVERHLDRNNFCTLGYEITEQYMREGKLLIRGQCNEKAKR